MECGYNMEELNALEVETLINKLLNPPFEVPQSYLDSRTIGTFQTPLAKIKTSPGVTFTKKELIVQWVLMVYNHKNKTLDLKKLGRWGRWP